ncbi:MAG: APC family permease [Bacteroidaceae bacterium]|nr:APC family permease [Bacteroidaceae bacterium]
MEQKNPHLRQQLSSLHVWALAFGCIIGWGAFINPGKKFLPNSGVYGTAIAMLLGALVMIILAFSYAYMVPKHPRAGGEFNFTKSCFGKVSAYFCGWFLLAAYLSNVPMNSTAIGLIVDGLDGNLDILRFGFHYVVSGFDVWFGEMLFAMSILILFGVLNILGVRKAGIIQALLSSLLAISVFILTVSSVCSSKACMMNMDPVWGFDRAGMIAAGASAADVSIFAKVGSLGIMSSILATFAITPWAFVGFETIPQAAEEFKVSYKKVIFIMVVAILFGAFVYIANNTVAAAAVINWPERVMAGEWVLLIAAEELLGTFGKVLIGVAVSCAVLSGIMGFYLASSRLMYSMGRDGYLPTVFSRIDPKYHTPKNALLFCILVSLSGPILGREALGWFVDMSSIGASIGFFFTAASTYKTMKQDGDGTVFLRIITVFGMIFSITFVTLQLVPIPGLIGVHFGKESYWMLIVWIAIGFAFSIRQRKYFVE